MKDDQSLCLQTTPNDSDQIPQREHSHVQQTDHRQGDAKACLAPKCDLLATTAAAETVSLVP